MEAVTIAGIAVVVAGGFYSAMDLLEDLGIRVKKPQDGASKVSLPRRSILTPQRRVEKMARMHV